MKRQDLLPAPAVKPVLVTSSAPSTPSAAPGSSNSSSANTGTTGDCVVQSGSSVVCVVPPARRFSPNTTGGAPASGAPLASLGPVSAASDTGPSGVRSAGGVAGSSSLQPLRHVLPPVVAVPSSACTGGSSGGTSQTGSLQRNLLSAPLSAGSTVAPPPPPHLLTALAQAAAGPHLTQYRRAGAPPVAAHAGSGPAGSAQVGVCGENLTMRRDMPAAAASFLIAGQSANQQQQQQQQVQVSQPSVQPGLSGTAHTLITAQRRPHPVLTPVLTPSPSPAAAPSKPAAAPPPAVSSSPSPAPPSSASAAESAAAAVQPGYHRLRVEDALSYLDQVKSKFQNNPEVYNDFLDIMKEFKAQNIDTPGVITRVSSLFRGHPALIVGFNTFLPPGYRIEVQSGNDYLHVSMTAPGQVTTVVHTPMGGLQTYHDQSTDSRPLGVLPSSSSVPSASVKNSPPSSAAVAGGGVGANASGGVMPAGVTQTTAQMQFRNSYGTNNIVSGHMGCNNSNSNSGTGGSPANIGVNVASLHSYTQQQQQQQPQLSTSSSHQISTAGVSAPASSAAPPNGGGGAGGGGGMVAGSSNSTSQPVEFKHAINYVNKIKNRFQGQPEVYKQFLEILHTYQKEQRCVKESVGGGSSSAPLSSGAAGGQLLSETEVYAKVAALFYKHSDLMDEFGQFLPDATNDTAFTAVSNSRSVHQDGRGACSASSPSTSQTAQPPPPSTTPLSDKPQQQQPQQPAAKSTTTTTASAAPLHHSPPASRQLKRPAASTSSVTSQQVALGGAAAPPVSKRARVGVLKDVTLAEAAKYGTLNDFAFFDQVRKTLRNQELYNNFLRVLSLYNAEVISRYEVIQLVTPFIGRKPGLLKWLKEFMGVKDGRDDSSNPCSGSFSALLPAAIGDDVSDKMAHRSANVSDLTVEIDPSTCKRLGASYCALPKTYLQPRCSGRNQLCRDVLNDVWVSFPSYSEDSTFVTSRKTLYEEYIYRCEDERFELDMVLETNLATIRILEGIQKRLQRMSGDESSRYRLDDCLGGTSPTIHQRAVRRIYGDKAADIIDGLKKNPLVAVPVVLRRLKAKQNEWREAQKGYNKVWREQNEKYYLKSLDPQGINFKQSDVKQLRSKQLLNELYQLFDERSEQQLADDEAVQQSSQQLPQLPHMELVYSSWSVLDDAADLIVHHVKRLTGVHKEDKAKIKRLVRHTLAGMFHQKRKQVESDEEEEGEDESEATPDQHQGEELASEGGDSANDRYTLFMASSNWYVLLRLHQILCERLCCIRRRADELVEEERQYRPLRTESAAAALRLKPSNEIEVEDYYPAFLDMVKCVLDNSMDSNQYEDTLREMFGTHAYHAYTADKIVSGAVRQLQCIVTENAAQLTLSEYLSASGSGGTGGTCSSAQDRQLAEHAYMKRVEQLLTEENEHCMKIYLFNRDGRMTVELLDTTDSEESDEANNNNNAASSTSAGGGGGVAATNARVSSLKTTTGTSSASTFEDDKRRATYQETFVDATVTDSDARLEQIVFLRRNIRRTAPKIAASASLSVEVAEPVVLAGDEAINVKQEPMGEEDTDMPADSSENISTTAAPIKPSTTPPPSQTVSASAELTLCENEQIRLDGGHRMTRVAKTGSLLARRNALKRARQLHRPVSERMNARFRDWHQRWADDHVTSDQRHQCDDWLMGRADNDDDRDDGNRWLTVCRRNNDMNRPPYSPYTRYCVKPSN